MATFNQRRSRLQERRVAKDLDGRVQPASGAMSHSKGDVRVVGTIRAECKFTNARQYTLKKSEWEKIKGEANRAGETPVMQVEFASPAGINVKLAVVDWNHYQGLRKRLEQIEAGTDPFFQRKPGWDR